MLASLTTRKIFDDAYYIILRLRRELPKVFNQIQFKGRNFRRSFGIDNLPKIVCAAQEVIG